MSIRTARPLNVWLLVFALLIAVHAGAQTPSPATPDNADISVAAIENFADAYVAVQTINQEYAARLEEIEDPDKAANLQRQAQNRMQQAVTNAGLSISDYHSIAEQANQNKDLRTNIEEAVAARVEPEK